MKKIKKFNKFLSEIEQQAKLVETIHDEGGLAGRIFGFTSDTYDAVLALKGFYDGGKLALKTCKLVNKGKKSWKSGKNDSQKWWKNWCVYGTC